MGPNEEYADSTVGFDGSSNTSESLYAEKHDTSSTHEIDSLKSTISGDCAGLSLSQSPQLEKGDPSDPQFLAQGTNDWVHAWSSDYCAENDLAAAYEENSRLRGSLEVAESSIVELKLEVNSLQSHAEEIGCEAQKFAKQLATEIGSGEELVKEVSVLKSECSKLKDDLEQLKVAKVCPPFSSREAIEAEQDQIFKDLQIRWLKGLLAMEDKIRELYDKACFGCHEGDFRFLRSDLEALLGVLQNLKQGTGLMVSSIVPSEEANLNEIQDMSSHKNGQFVAGAGFDVDLYQPELGMLHCLNIPGLVSHEPDSIDATNALKGKIFELLRELDESKAEREGLAKKMDQMECYYEALVQELEENQRQMLGELQNLRNEHSTCLYTVSSTKTEMETMHQDLNEQLLRLAEDKRDLDSLNKELERRAITAEAALKRARLNYSIAVDQLQKDLELLSFQVVSLFETNENLVRQAFVDSSQPSFHGHPEMAESQKFDSREVYAAKLLQFQNQSVGVKKQHFGGDILLDDLKRSLHLQEGLYRKVEEEVCEMHSVNIYLDVLSRALQETMLEASDDVKSMKQKINELMLQLELSTESKDLLMQKLQSAMDDVRTLNEYNATCIAKCNDMAQQNHILESNLQNITHEKHLLVQKITEWESLAMQYRSYETLYEACATEKTELACLLEMKTLENGNLQNEIFCLQEELKAVRTEFDDLVSVKENLQNLVNFLQHKLQNLLVSYDKSLSGLPPLSESGSQDLESSDLAGVLMRLEEIQHVAREKIIQLMEENEGLVHERDIARVSVTAAESEISLIKQKFEHDIRNTVDKLDVSNTLVQKLQLDIEVIANKLKVSSEAEEKYALQHKELFSDLDRLEVELRELTSENRDLAHEILALETVTNELGRSKLIAAELTNENQALMATLRDKNEESTKLTSELKSLRESLQALQDENKTLVVSSQEKTEESSQLASEVNSLKDSLQSLHDENQALMASSQDKTEEAAKIASELNSLKENLRFLHDKNQALMVSSQDKMMESAQLALELNILKESLQSLHDKNEALMAFSRDKAEESSKLASELNSLKESLQSLHDEKEALMASSREKTEETSKLVSELNSLKERMLSLHDENQVLMACSHDKSKESAKLASELNSLRECLLSLHNENQALMVSSRDKTEESAQLAAELNSLRESLQSLHDELHDERSLRGRLESTITNLTSQLNEKQCQLLQFDQHECELVYLKQLVSDLESEKSRVCHLLLQSEECLKIAREESSSVSALETQLSEAHELLIATDVRLSFMKAHYEGTVEGLIQQLYSSDKHFAELHKKHIDVESILNRCLASEVQYIEQNARLSTSLNSFRSELEASTAENRLLLETNRVVRAELEEYKSRAQNVGLTYHEDKSQRSLEVERLKCMLLTSEEEIDNLMCSQEELEIKVLVLQAKLDEQRNQIISLEGCYDELVMLQKECSELNQELSEQILKTEEFRNLSVHLKELKDKADAACIQAREKREPEGPPVAMQESLRIAFIKEQYETRLQELKHQLSISKKHSEEMLWKLQDAVDEIENRKKSEAAHLKKNEELGMKILELESELQSIVSDKREKMNAYDLMKAEMECSLISLECCKEEKQKLEASLQESNEEKSKIAVELTLMKELLKNSKSAMNMQLEENNGSCKVDFMSSEKPDLRNVHQKNPIADNLSYGRKIVDSVLWNGLTGEPILKLEPDSSTKCNEAEHACPAPVHEVDHSSTLTNVQLEQVINEMKNLW